MTFTSTLQNMHPDVAEAIAKQFPDYFDTCKELADTALSAFEEDMKSDDAKFQTTYNVLNAHMDYLGAASKKPKTMLQDLPFWTK